MQEKSLLCCVCRRKPPTVFVGKARFCEECHDPKPFLEESAKADAEDAKEQAKLERWREAQRKKKEKK